MPPSSQPPSRPELTGNAFQVDVIATASRGGRPVITLRYRNLSTGEVEFLDQAVPPGRDAHVWFCSQGVQERLGWLDARGRRETQTWRVIFGVNHRPFIVERIEAGAGIVPGEPPPALMARVVERYGPLDPSGGFAPDSADSVAFDDIEWPVDVESTSVTVRETIGGPLTNEGTLTDVPSPQRDCPTCRVEAVSVAYEEFPRVLGRRYTLTCPSGHVWTWDCPPLPARS